ncbi:MAG: hypothetical protein IT320_26120 [Anaerolineae bacterium]|nr:hypothetical protein [Anaerolineae bacterium]
MQRRTNPIWGLIILAVAAAIAARAFGWIPDNAFDMLVRAAPALLVLLALATLLRNRLPFGRLIALLVTLALVGVIAVTSFNTRSAQVREDNRQTIDQPLSADVTLLRLRVQTLATDVELARALDPAPVVHGEFVGSLDNMVDVSYEIGSDNSVTLTLREVRQSAVPSLETVGRGTMRLDLPPNVPLDVEYVGEDGDVVLNLGGTSLERLNVSVAEGDVVVTLPEYQPRFSDPDETLGALTTLDGALTLRVPETVAAHLELNRGGSGIQPQYDPNVYNYLVGDVLEARTIETSAIVVRYTLTAPRGLIRLDVPEAVSG